MVCNDAPFFVSHRLALAASLLNAGYAVHVAVPDDGKAVCRIAEKGLIVHAVPFNRKSMNPLNEARTLRVLWRLYRHLRPHIVHHVTSKPILLGGIVARALGLPAVVNAVTGLGYLFSRRDFAGIGAQVILRRVYRAILGNGAAFTIFQNPDDLLEIWGARGGHRSVIIRGSGVDTTEFMFSRESDETPVVVLAARMLWSKGVGDFVAAARRLHEQNVPCRCVIVGDPDPQNPESIPKDILESWHAEGSVQWWGFRPNMADVFRHAHVIVLPTVYREGVPKVLIEAASCGRALVASNMPGCREIVVDGETGILVPPRDPVALADAIKMLVEQPDRRRAMGVAGRRLVEASFSLDRVIIETLKLYERILNGTKKGQVSDPTIVSE